MSNFVSRFRLFDILAARTTLSGGLLPAGLIVDTHPSDDEFSAHDHVSEEHYTEAVCVRACARARPRACWMVR